MNAKMKWMIALAATALTILTSASAQSTKGNYWVVEGNVGAVEKFSQRGGASIRARRIGSASGSIPTTRSE